MKKTIKKNLTTSTIIFLLLLQIGEVIAQNMVHTHQDTIPVLIGKENNPVLRINIPVDGVLSENQVTEIAINFIGTTRIEEIESLSLFYTGKNIMKKR